MKKLFLLLLLLLSSSTIFSQKLLFEYDTAGNQTQRIICITCRMATGKSAENANTISKSEMFKTPETDKILYYPNPVLEELYLRWELSDGKEIENIALYNMSGVQLTQIKSPKAETILTIPFITYPSGNYIITLFYSDGESKSIKIMKK